MEQHQIKHYVDRVLESFAEGDEHNINKAMLAALECLPFDYGTGNYEKVYTAALAEMRKRIAK